MTDRGLKCPKCACPMSEVVRTTKVLGKVRRRRVCGWCGASFFTVETVTAASASVSPAPGTQKRAHVRESEPEGPGSGSTR